MDFFELPKKTQVNRVVPKNAFDRYTNTKQKKLFTDKVSRITWTHKLSAETVNLEGKEIEELQIFKVELKTQDEIQPVLDIIDISIPYTILFLIQCGDKAYISTSKKHPYATNEDNAVIDWTFKTGWFDVSSNPYSLKLRKNLDSVFRDLCFQISGKADSSDKHLDQLIEQEQQREALEKQIEKIRKKISSKTVQFKEKVKLNMVLQRAEDDLKKL